MDRLSDTEPVKPPASTMLLQECSEAAIFIGSGAIHATAKHSVIKNICDDDTCADNTFYINALMRLNRPTAECAIYILSV